MKPRVNATSLQALQVARLQSKIAYLKSIACEKNGAPTMLCGSTVALRLILLHAAFLIAEKPSLEIPEQKGPIGIVCY